MFRRAGFHRKREMDASAPCHLLRKTCHVGISRLRWLIQQHLTIADLSCAKRLCLMIIDCNPAKFGPRRLSANKRPAFATTSRAAHTMPLLALLGGKELSIKSRKRRNLKAYLHQVSGSRPR